jgi:trehalose-phosphatase
VGRELEELLAPIVSRPAEAAILLDIDGTLAPIVVDPAEAEVPAATREVLRRLARSYGLVACISGRRALDAKEMIGIDEIEFIGNHGIETLEPGTDEIVLIPEVGGAEAKVVTLLAALDLGGLEEEGVRVEDKGPLVALHWRGAEDAARAEAAAERVAEQASAQGLDTRRGRCVLEIRPDVEADKGIAIERLLARDAAIQTALYAGDDRTDADAFKRLHELKSGGRLRAAACIGIASAETPETVIEHADVIVEGVSGFAEVLAGLTEA